MADKASVQALLTIAEAKLAEANKQENEAKSNGPDSRHYALRDLTTAIANVRTEVEALA
jgi:hypothetical protein